MEDQPLSLEEIKADARAIYDAGIELFNFLLTKGLLPSLPASAVSRAHKSKAARKKRRKSVKK